MYTSVPYYHVYQTCTMRAVQRQASESKALHAVKPRRVCMSETGDGRKKKKKEADWARYTSLSGLGCSGWHDPERDGCVFMHKLIRKV